MTDDVERTVQIAVEALPFWYADHNDKTLRMWIARELHGIEVPLTQATIDYQEMLFQWIKKGKPKEKKPHLKAVK